MRQLQGFTLIEVMITVAIVAVLAAIAVPNYTDYITRSKFTEAHGMLADLRVKMEQYYMDNRRYSSTAGGGTCGIPGGASPTVTGVKYFSYTCASSTPNASGDQQYTVTATGLAGAGLSGIAFTVDHANTRATNVTASSAMATKGYTAGTPSATCWVLKKPAQC